jgi:hypothetical protein
VGPDPGRAKTTGLVLGIPGSGEGFDSNRKVGIQGDTSRTIT